MKKLAIGTALGLALFAGSASAQNVKIGLLVKSLGNGFFEAANKGAQEAAKELGGVEVIYTGPTTTTAEGQIEVINALIAQRVNAIAISANDPDAVVPALKQAAQRGIKVISWDSAVGKDGRIIHLNPSSNELIGNMCLKLAAYSSAGRQGRFRHSVRDLHLDQPEHLDRRDEEAAPEISRASTSSRPFTATTLPTRAIAKLRACSSRSRM